MRQGLTSVLYRIGISTVTVVTETWVGRSSALGPAQAPTQNTPRALSPGVKRPRDQDIQSLEPSSSQVKEVFKNTYTFPLAARNFRNTGCVIVRVLLNHMSRPSVYRILGSILNLGPSCLSVYMVFSCLLFYFSARIP